uniref:Small ribosomal subunit protein uS14c n=1 Tax=Yamadaella caenomyce TaxID=259029 RepID=A0A1G4NYR2_9FLOR|nr:Ribosomal protein S14 [Yamadaella caenomyce]SCW23831.1 Ribosomal protein S14 [Yamadaella caenomyce]
MAKEGMKEREKRKVQLVHKYRNKREAIKKAINSSNSFKRQLEIQEQLQKLPRRSAKSKLRNRCWLTGRSRGFYRDFGLSRHVLREMTHQCLLPGITKASW